MEIIQITCQLISDPKHQIINDCGVCPGVDIIASIAQYSTEIFPMTGQAPMVTIITISLLIGQYKPISSPLIGHSHPEK